MVTADSSQMRDQGEGLASTDARPRTALRLTLGILLIVVGVLVLLHPVNTLLFVAVLLGIQLVVLGVVQLATLSSVGSRGLRIASAVFGVVTVIAGIICFFRPNASLFLVALLLGFGWIADGIANVCRAFSRRSAGIEKTYLLLQGVLAVVAGLLVVFFPDKSLVLLAEISGIALLLIGLVACVWALLGRRRSA